MRPVQEGEFVARIFGEIANVFSNLSNNNFIQTNFGLKFAFQAKN